jgi:hypothetical protein
MSQVVTVPGEPFFPDVDRDYGLIGDAMRRLL